MDIPITELEQTLEQIESYATDCNEAAAHCGHRCWVRATEAEARADALAAQAKSLLGAARMLLQAADDELYQRFAAQIAAIEPKAEALHDLAYAMADLDNATLTVHSELAQATEDSEMGVDGGYYTMWWTASNAIDRLVARVVLPEVSDSEAVALSELACETLADAFEQRYEYRWTAPEF